MIKPTYDVSRYSAMDKANLYFAIAIDETDRQEQYNMLIAVLYQSSMAGVSPIDYLIEKITDLPLKSYEDAKFNIARIRNPELIKKLGSGGDTDTPQEGKRKIAVSIGEVLDQYHDIFFEGSSENA